MCLKLEINQGYTTMHGQSIIKMYQYVGSVQYVVFLLYPSLFLFSNYSTFVFLTLRLLMSYIYMEHLFLMFLDHTQRHSTVGRTPLDE